MECYVDKRLCKKADSEVCGCDCRAYILLESIYGDSNIPRKYQYDRPLVPESEDLESFKVLRSFRENIQSHVSKGRNLFIMSKFTGNGKTTWACKIGQEFIKKNLFTHDIDNLIYYVNVPELMEELRCGYENGDYVYIMNKLKSAKLVIFDDLGAEKSTDWVRERLYTIINYRVLNGLSSIYTSNLNLDELTISLGNRVVSRLKEETLMIEFFGKDRRGV